MLSKRARLTKAAFDNHFKTGKRIHTPHLQIIRSHSPTFHGAVVVGKKVFTRAVDRNRLRRRLYGVLYQAHTTSPLSGIWIVIVKPAAKTQPYATIKGELQQIIGQVSKKAVQ